MYRIDPNRVSQNYDKFLLSDVARISYYSQKSIGKSDTVGLDASPTYGPPIYQVDNLADL